MREIAASSPGDFLKAFPDGAIIDEAQKVPEIFDSIKLVVDSVEYQPEKYILTGSSQFRLRENITDRMAGRIALLNLFRMDTKEELLLDDHKGAAVETMAVSELLKSRWNTGKKANLTFYRDKNGFEVDTIADWKKSYAIEVKSSSDPEKKMSSSVRKYVNLRSDGTAGQVYYLGDLTCEVDGVKYVSWRDWGA